MSEYDRLLGELDRSVMRVAQSNKNIGSQEFRISAAKCRGDDTTRSESLLAEWREALRLHQDRYDRLSLELDRLVGALR